MKLLADKLKTKATEAGVTQMQLAQAVARVDLQGDRALSAVRSWMAGRHQPAAKLADVTKLAGALRCAPKDIVRFTSQVKNHRGSPRKAKLIVDLVRGRHVDEALNLLAFTPHRAAINVRKCLSAAIADAEQNDADVTSLFVTESTIDDGPRLKRFQPKDRGRAHAIIKRFAHITIGVEERAKGEKKGNKKGRA